MGFVLLVLLIVVGWIWAIVNHIRRFDVERFGDEMAKKAEATWPLIADELTLLVNNIIPVAETALQKELEAAAPQLAERFNIEARTLEANVRASVAATMKQFLTVGNRASALQELRSAFPELQGGDVADRLAASLQESFMLAAQQRLNSMLMQYYDAILRFGDAFGKLRASASGGPPATLETVLSLWVELLYEKMGGDGAMELQKK